LSANKINIINEKITPKKLKKKVDSINNNLGLHEHPDESFMQIDTKNQSKN